MNIKLIEKANEIIKKVDNVSFGVIDENGYPHICAMSLSYPENINELYVTTTIDSNKIRRIKNNSKVSINYFTINDNITLAGEATILTDQESKSKYWQPWFKEVYPGGETDPSYCVIKFTTKKATLYIDEEVGEFDLAEK